jgi:RNA polymerase sigma-70 factor (ECF subfamily)
MRMQPTPPPLDAGTFAAVLTGAKAGEEWAAQALFIDLQPRLLRFLRSTEPRVADDIAGEVWLAMAKGIGAFEGDLDGFRAWVFSIARRRVADFRRTAVRRRTDPVDYEYFTEFAATTDISEATIAALSGQEAIDLVARLLPPDQAEVLMLRIVADLDVARVAEVMGRPATWVRVTQHRALRRLADVMQRKPEEHVTPTAAPTI